MRYIARSCDISHDRNDDLNDDYNKVNMIECIYCNKTYSTNSALNRHLKGYNKCSFTKLQEQYNIEKIETLENENIELKKKIEELTERLIEKPSSTTIINQHIENQHIEKLECNITRDEYWKGKTGFYISYDFIQDRKIEKLKDYIINQIKQNFKQFNYWYVLTTINNTKEYDIINAVLIKDKNRGSLEVKCCNNVDDYKKDYYHKDLNKELELIHRECVSIINSLSFKALKYFKTHHFYMNKLRIELNNRSKIQERHWKTQKEEMLCIKDN